MRLISSSLLAAALLSLGAFAAAADPVADGKKVFMTKTCLACHGKGGAKPVLSYPALAGQNEKYMLTQLKAIADGSRVGTVDPTTGHPYVQGMADIMHLVTEDDMKNVVAYLAAQPPGPPKPLDPPADPATLAAGEAAYNALGCKSCHGKDALKPSAKSYPQIAGLNRDYLIRAMTEIRDKVRTTGQTKLMWGVIKKADDTEIEQIATWLSQIDRSQK
ncbi:MAG: cytochrome c [Paenirhodobacter sp.]|uniref:c-type cytochrome n=1 Tax=Paenirhodobacter sp. TaxID=1965326 RepID=UPI003D0E58E8